MSLRRVALGTVCAQDRTSVRPGHGDDLPYLGLEGIESGTGQFVVGELSKTPEAPQANSFRFDERHVLYGKLRPYLNKVALPTAPGKCSTEIIPLLPTPPLDRQYMSYFLRAPATVQQIAERSSGARMPRADMDFVLSLPIGLPPINEQRRIVDLLARAEGIIRLRREAQQKAAELIPAIFIDMFGDPATNPKRWPVGVLGDLSDVQGGLQVSGSRSGLPLTRPYLRVANVYRCRLDLAEVKTIDLTAAEFDRTRLQRGDLLVVEGHGNPEEVGRVAVWDGSVEECTHQNHLIRARPLRDRLLPHYACALLNSASGRQSLRRAGKTTSGLSTISARSVKEASVMLPPVAMQAEFERDVEAVGAIERQQAAALDKARAAFDALLAQAFGG